MLIFIYRYSRFHLNLLLWLAFFIIVWCYWIIQIHYWCRGRICSYAITLRLVITCTEVQHIVYGILSTVQWCVHIALAAIRKHGWHIHSVYLLTFYYIMCHKLDKLYLVPSFLWIAAGSSKIGFVRIHSNRRSSRYDGLPQIALSGGFAFFCYGSLDQSSAEVTCRSAGYQRAVQYQRVNVTGDAVDLGNLITRANCSGDEVNLKSCSLTIGQGQCKDNALQYIECEEAAETVPSLGEEKS